MPKSRDEKIVQTRRFLKSVSSRIKYVGNTITLFPSHDLMVLSGGAQMGIRGTNSFFFLVRRGGASNWRMNNKGGKVRRREWERWGGNGWFDPSLETRDCDRKTIQGQ